MKLTVDNLEAVLCKPPIVLGSVLCKRLPQQLRLILVAFELRRSSRNRTLVGYYTSVYTAPYLQLHIAIYMNTRVKR